VPLDSAAPSSPSSSTSSPALDRWTEVVTGGDPDGALVALVSDFGHKFGVTACVLLQPESSHLSEQAWSYCLPGEERFLDTLTDAARRATGLDLLAAAGAAHSAAQYVCALTGGADSGGVLALQPAATSVPTESQLKPWLSIFTSALSVRSEMLRLRSLVSQYQRGFQTLDRQVRVLDLERQKLAAVLNNAEIGFLVLDSQLCVTWANPAMALRLNASASGFGILRQSCREVVCGELEPCEACPARSAQVLGEARRGEINSTCGTERRRLFATAVPIKGSSGHVQETLLMVQDLSRLDALSQT